MAYRYCTIGTRISIRTARPVGAATLCRLDTRSRPLPNASAANGLSALVTHPADRPRRSLLARERPAELNWRRAAAETEMVFKEAFRRAVLGDWRRCSGLFRLCRAGSTPRLRPLMAPVRGSTAFFENSYWTVLGPRPGRDRS